MYDSRTLWNILLMAPRIKLIVIFNLLWSEFVETNAKFRSASTALDHALVVCDLTQIPADGSGCRWGGAVGIPDLDPK